MRYALCSIAGIALALVGVVLIATAAHTMSRMGICVAGLEHGVSGCPELFGLDLDRMTGGIVGLIAGAGLFAARAPRSAPAGGGFGSAAVGMAFIGVAGAVWTAARGAGALSDTVSITTTGIAVGAGAIGALCVVSGLVRSFRPRGHITPEAVMEAGGIREALRQARAEARRATDPAASTTFSSDNPDDKD